MEIQINLNDAVKELFKSEHGDYKTYVPTAKKVGTINPEFLARLIAYNAKNGQIRDSKVALPIISLSVDKFSFIENSLAHLYLLSPRELLKACYFAKDLRIVPNTNQFKDLVNCYLQNREKNKKWFDRTVIQHRKSLKGLYALNHIKPSKYANNILFENKYTPGSVFDQIKNLKNMLPQQAASFILAKKIPFLVAINALGEKRKDTDVLLAIIESMTANELVTNSKMLEKLGISTNPILRAAYDEGLNKKVATSKTNTFKSDKAIESVTDKKTKEKLKGIQEKQLKTLGGIEGDWLILGDRSGSMEKAIEVARIISGTLSTMVKNSVHLCFFDNRPLYYNVTNKTYDEIKQITKYVRTGGSTSIGCGLQYMLDKELEVDGIAIISDGEENCSPLFADTYKKYCKKFDKEPTLYFYKIRNSNDTNLDFSLRNNKLDYELFNLGKSKIDYYSLPNLISSMRVNRYSLIDEIMNTPLLTLSDIVIY
jgi:hypothetical protein